jgi:hypothetical protein
LAGFTTAGPSNRHASHVSASVRETLRSRDRPASYRCLRTRTLSSARSVSSTVLCGRPAAARSSIA